MKTIDIYGANRFSKHTKIREACRGIVLSDDKILMTYETKIDQWMIPGGGMEAWESREECLVRELAEETGIKVRPLTCFLQINEYYEEWLFISYYYICEPVGTTERKLTSREIAVGQEPRWISVKDTIQIFSKHQEYAASDEMKRGMYQREYEALKSMMEV